MTASSMSGSPCSSSAKPGCAVDQSFHRGPRRRAGRRNARAQRRRGATVDNSHSPKCRASGERRILWSCLGSASPPPRSNVVVGDLDGNAARILAAYEQAEAAGCDVVVLSRAHGHGLPARRSAAAPGVRRAGRRDARQGRGPHRRAAPRSIGFPEPGRDLHNAAAVCANGRVLRRVPQAAAPELRGVRRAALLRRAATSRRRCSTSRACSVGVSICEDAWSPTGPILAEAAGGAELIVNLNASPYYAATAARARDDARDAAPRTPRCRSCTRTSSAARTSSCSTARRSCSTRHGRLVARAKQFDEDLLVVDIDVRPSYRKRQLDPRGRSASSAARRGPRHRCAARRRAARATHRDRARAGARGLRSARARHPRLRAQERLHRRADRPVGRRRLVARRRDRGRRARRRARAPAC